MAVEKGDDLPVAWLALVVFAVTYLVTGGIYAVVMALAVGERARSFKAVSPGMLPPLGIIFGLLAAFLAAQVWGDLDRANTAVNREASALRAVVLLSTSFPGEPGARLRGLVGRHIQEAVTQEWPMMASQRASLTIMPRSLAEALQLTLSLTPSGVLIASHNRPFSEELSVRPDLLLQVMPERYTGVGTLVCSV